LEGRFFPTVQTGALGFSGLLCIPAVENEGNDFIILEKSSPFCGGATRRRSGEQVDPKSPSVISKLRFLLAEPAAGAEARVVTDRRTIQASSERRFLEPELLWNLGFIV